MFVLYLIYRLLGKLEKTVTPEEGNTLVGRSVTIYLHLCESDYKAWVTVNSETRQIKVRSEYPTQVYRPGETFTITRYENGIYYIL